MKLSQLESQDILTFFSEQKVREKLSSSSVLVTGAINWKKLDTSLALCG